MAQLAAMMIRVAVLAMAIIDDWGTLEFLVNEPTQIQTDARGGGRA